MTVMVAAKFGLSPEGVKKEVDSIFKHLDKDHSNSIEFEGE